MRVLARQTAERDLTLGPRWGSARRGGRYPVWAHDGSVAAARRLRCGARAARAPAVPPFAGLNGLQTSRRPRRSVVCGAGLPLVSLRSSPPHKSPTPDTAHRAGRCSCSSSKRCAVLFLVGHTGALAKPWSGVRRQRHCAALRSAGLVAARAQRALPHLTRRDCSSAANAVSAASFAAGHETEHRKGVGPQGRPPYTSAGAYPAAALPSAVCA
jgi:hypothetical protein